MSSSSNIPIQDLIKICNGRLNARIEILKLTYDPGFYSIDSTKDKIKHAMSEYDRCINNIAKLDILTN